MIVNGHFVLVNGTISWIGTYQIEDPAESVREDSFEYAVVGGTGDFAGATGTLRTFDDDRGRRVAALDVACSE